MFILLSLFTAMGALAWLLYILWYVLLVIGLWSMFTKAGVAGWKSLIPIYNFYILFKISWTSSMFWVWVLLLLISTVLGGYAYSSGSLTFLANVVDVAMDLVLIVLWLKTSQAYGHGLGYAIGLWLINPLFIMIIGLGSSRYYGPRP